jgi:hypothetical protein
MATPQEIGDRTVAYALSLMGDDWSEFESGATASFRPHLGALVAALPMPLRTIDVKHVWRSGEEWHVETEVTGDEGARVLLLRYLDGSPPKLLGGGVRALS